MLSLPAISAIPLTRAFGQTAPPAAATGPAVWRDFAAIAIEANKLGLSVPRMQAGVQGGTGYDDLMPALVDFMEGVESSASQSAASPADVERILTETSDLLRRLRQGERSPQTDRDETTGAAVAARPTVDSTREEYIELFRTCTIRDNRQATVNWYVNKLLEPTSRPQYEDVADRACVPWYFVGIIHGLEASFDFRSHLHNGDSLKAKTVQVPKGRPPVWNPPTDWVSSAIDAVSYENFADKPDWTLPDTLYRFEAYNGFGSRGKGIHTPYLWSFSNQYTKGKYVADGVWDPNAVSQQCGAAVMLKVLVEKGIVYLPA
jgi:lysozyme family protein